jgi:hypothetical protein
MQTGRTGAINAQVHKKKVASEFFATNAANPLHWIQNSYFGAFRTISILQKVDAKLAKLVPLSHKFAK